MTEKELRKLNRIELLELLIEQSKELEKLRGQLEEANKKLEDRKISIEKAGSIAEASLQINGVFEAAQAAARQYLENIQYLSEHQDQICWAKQKETEERCEKLLRQTEEAVEQKWKELSVRLEKFVDEHKDLRKILDIEGIL